MIKRFWEYEVTGDTKEHAQRGTGPATDYATPMHTAVHAPFAGKAEYFWTAEGGHGVRVRADGIVATMQHLAGRPKTGNVEWRESIALSGNSGSATTGPHVHAYIIKNGKRMSFGEWLRTLAKPDPAGEAEEVEEEEDVTEESEANMYPVYVTENDKAMKYELVGNSKRAVSKPVWKALRGANTRSGRPLYVEFLTKAELNSIPTIK